MMVAERTYLKLALVQGACQRFTHGLCSDKTTEDALDSASSDINKSEICSYDRSRQLSLESGQRRRELRHFDARSMTTHFPRPSLVVAATILAVIHKPYCLLPSSAFSVSLQVSPMLSIVIFQASLARTESSYSCRVLTSPRHVT